MVYIGEGYQEASGGVGKQITTGEDGGYSNAVRLQLPVLCVYMHCRVRSISEKVETDYGMLIRVGLNHICTFNNFTDFPSL